MQKSQSFEHIGKGKLVGVAKKEDIGKVDMRVKTSEPQMSVWDQASNSSSLSGISGISSVTAVSGMYTPQDLPLQVENSFSDDMDPGDILIIYPNAVLYYKLWKITVNRCLYICAIHAVELLTILILHLIDQSYSMIALTVAIHLVYMSSVAGIYHRNISIILFAIVFYLLNLILNMFMFFNLLNEIKFSIMSTSLVFFYCLILDTVITLTYVVIATVAFIEAMEIEAKKEVVKKEIRERKMALSKTNSKTSKNIFPEQADLEITETRIMCTSLPKATQIVVVMHLLLTIILAVLSYHHLNQFGVLSLVLQLIFHCLCMFFVYCQWIKAIKVGLYIHTCLLVFWHWEWAMLLGQLLTNNSIYYNELSLNLHPLVEKLSIEEIVHLLTLVVYQLVLFYAILVLATAAYPSKQKRKACERPIQKI